jgi:hypothetical protein
MTDDVMTATSQCVTCTDPTTGVEGECPRSERRCGHHCNHVWNQDVCHWCQAEVDDAGTIIPNYAMLAADLAVDVERLQTTINRALGRTGPHDTPALARYRKVAPNP